MKRRSIFLGTAALSVTAGLVGWRVLATTSSGTTSSVNLPKLNAYELAVQNGSDALLANILIAQAINIPKVIVIETALSNAGSAIAAINAEAQGAHTLNFNAYSVPWSLVSLVNDVVTVYEAFRVGIHMAGPAVPPYVISKFNALQTIVAIMMFLCPVPTKAIIKLLPLPGLPMSEAKALKTLNAG